MTESKPNYYVHESAIVEASEHAIGKGTRIWAFAHVLPRAVIGRDCNICDHVFIENDVTIGDRVTIKSGVQLWDGITLEDDVFIGPNATFTNDKFPRSREYPEEFEKTIIKKGASIGANATILPGLTIGAGSMVGAGAVVTRSIPARAIVTGNPAYITAYSDTKTFEKMTQHFADERAEPSVRGVQLIDIKHVPDMRGDLCATEFDSDLPFQPKRIFLVFNVPNARVRGAHAHKQCQQFLLCVSGSVAVIADDGINREEYYLDSPSRGVYLPAGIWGTQYKYSEDAVLMVLASHEYDADDYIRDYEQFLESIK